LLSFWGNQNSFYQKAEATMQINKMPRVMIMEPQADGHHGPYVTWMAKGLADRGVNVTIVTLQKSIGDPSFQRVTDYNRDRSIGEVTLLGPEMPRVDAIIESTRNNLIQSQFAYWYLFREWYRALNDSVSPDVVFVPYLDYCLYAISLLGSPFAQCPWVGLPMRAMFHFKAMGVLAPNLPMNGLKKYLFYRVLRNKYLRRFLTIDPSLYLFFKEKISEQEKIIMLPEPAEFGDLPNTDLAKRQLGLKTDRHLLLVFGTLAQRKGIRSLLRALAHPDFPMTVDVLLAGKGQDEIDTLLKNAEVQKLVFAGRLKVMDRFVEYKEVPMLLAAADAVWLGYEKHLTTSGVLVQAARAEVPVLACAEGVIGWQVKRYKLGTIMQNSDVGSVIKAVKTSISGKPSSGRLNSDCLSDDSGIQSNPVDALLQALFGTVVR
jgi:glycosyltransferase involved in cell wall biosynthesis